MEDFLSGQTFKSVTIGICILIGVAGIVLVILGFSSLEATEYGLDYSWISKSINPKSKQNGLYFLGIGHSFIKFPKNVQTIEFSFDSGSNRKPIQSRTSDGLEVILEISFQYTLDPNGLHDLYKKYGSNYKSVFENVAIDILTEEATKYTAYSFFWDRGNIKDQFQLKLDETFREICYSNVQFLQLRSVDLPNAFEEAIQASEVKKQDIQKAKAELNKVAVEIDTKVKAAEFQKNVTLNNAQAEAQSLLKQNEAEANSITQIVNSLSESYKQLKNKLGLTNNQVLNFMKNKLIKQHESKNVAVNIDSLDK